MENSVSVSMPVRIFLRLLGTSMLALLMARCAVGAEACRPARVQSGRVAVEFHCGNAVLWELQVGENKTYSFAPPIFPLQSGQVIAGLRAIHQDAAAPQGEGIVQYSFGGPLIANPALAVRVLMRISPKSPIIRFRYILEAATAAEK